MRWEVKKERDRNRWKAAVLSLKRDSDGWGWREAREEFSAFTSRWRKKSRPPNWFEGIFRHGEKSPISLKRRSRKLMNILPEKKGISGFPGFFKRDAVSEEDLRNSADDSLRRSSQLRLDRAENGQRKGAAGRGPCQREKQMAPHCALPSSRGQQRVLDRVFSFRRAGPESQAFAA